MDRKYNNKSIRDRTDLRRNLINSVFEGLKAEDCFADRGDAGPVKRSVPNHVKLDTKNTEEPRKRLSETKNPKAQDRGEDRDSNWREKDKNDVANSKEKVKKLTVKIENLICPIKAIQVNSGRKEDTGKALKKDNIRDKSDVIKTYLDLEGRKRLRERYTVKLKNCNKHSEENVKDTTKLFDEFNKTKVDEEIKVKSKSEQFDANRNKTAIIQRKPIIKTIRVNNDNRVYKAVTFVDHKQTTPIQIKIPGDKKTLKLEMKNKTTEVAKEPVKVVHKKHKKRHRLKGRIASPEMSKRQSSPPTEVAKWAPSCVNQHTKPYYEAWVDTTLAAITKCSKNDELYFEKQNIIKTFKRALEQRIQSPEVLHENCYDERYTGRIRVRQK